MLRAAVFFDISKVDCPLAVFYQETIGQCIHGEKIGCALEDQESGKLTFSVGTIANNEQEVFIHADVRFPVTFTVDEVTRRLQEAVKPYGVTVSVDEYTSPEYMDKNGSVMCTLLGAYRDVTSDYSEPLVIGGASYARAMDNIIAFGPLLPGRESLEHQSDEYISLEDLRTIRQIYYLALKRLAT